MFYIQFFFYRFYFDYTDHYAKFLTNRRRYRIIISKLQSSWRGLCRIFRNILTNPLILVESGFWFRKFVSIFILFSSVAFLPIINKPAMAYLMPTVPIFAYAMISNEPFLDYSKHYMLVASAFILLVLLLRLAKGD